MRRAREHNLPGGFSLLEMLAVVMVMAILAMAVGWSLRGVGKEKKLDDVIDRVQTFDAVTRGMASTRGYVGGGGGGGVAMVIDIENQRAHRVDLITDKRLGATVSLPIMAVETQVGTTIESQHKSATLITQANERGPSYFLQLDHAPSETKDGANHKTTWLYVSGWTGQVTRLNHETEHQKIINALDASRLDLD